MTTGLDDRRPDHTRPTIAFIVLAVAAAAVMTAGMTGNQPETPVAADRPKLGAPVVPAPATPPPSPEPPAFPEFSMADVVTLAAAKSEATPRPERTRSGVEGAGSGTTGTPDGGPGVSATSGGGGSGVPSGSSGGGGTTSGTSGSGGGADAAGSGSGGTTDPGPGRSTTGQRHAPGQRDGTPPGRGGSAKKSDRVVGRR